MVGAVLDVTSYGFAPLSLLAPLGSISLLANLVVAKRVLGEPRHRVDWLACAIIATGTLLAVVFSAKSTALHPLGVVLGNLGSAVFMVYAAALGIGYSLAVHIARAKDPDGPGGAPRDAPAPVRAVGATVAWCVASSMVGSVGVAVCKVLAEAAVGATPVDLVSAQACVLAAGAGTAMLTQLRTMNRAIRTGGALLAVPLAQVATLVLNLLAGAVVFQDFSRVKHPQGTVFGAGVAIALCGTGLLVAHGLRTPRTDTPQSQDTRVPL